MNRNVIKNEHLVVCLVNFDPNGNDWENDTRFVEALKKEGTPLNSHYTKQIVRHYKSLYKGEKAPKTRGTYAVLSCNDILK